MLVRLPSCAWCATSGATTAALEFIPMQTTSNWPLGAAHMLHPGPTCSAHQGGGVLWHRVHAFNPLFWGSLSIRPSSQAQTSTIASGPASEWGRFLQFNCNGIQHCHTELQVFLHVHQVLVACVQETKVGVNSTLKDLTGYATIRRDRLTRGRGIVTLIHHRVYGCLMMTYFPMTTRWTFWQLRQTLEEPHWHSSTCISPSVFLPPTLTPFWWNVETKWCLATLKHPTFLLVLQNRGWQGSGLRGVPRWAINSSQLSTINRVRHPRQMPFWAGISNLMWRGSSIPPLGPTTSP